MNPATRTVLFSARFSAGLLIAGQLAWGLPAHALDTLRSGQEAETHSAGLEQTLTAGLEEPTPEQPISLAPGATVDTPEANVSSVQRAVQIPLDSLALPESIAGEAGVNFVQEVLQAVPSEVVVSVEGSLLIDPEAIQDVDLVLYVNDNPAQIKSLDAWIKKAREIVSAIEESIRRRHPLAEIGKTNRIYESTIAYYHVPWKRSGKEVVLSLTMVPMTGFDEKIITRPNVDIPDYGWNPLQPKFGLAGSPAFERFVKMIPTTNPWFSLPEQVSIWYESLIWDGAKLSRQPEEENQRKARSRLAMAAHARGDQELARRIKRAEVSLDEALKTLGSLRPDFQARIAELQTADPAKELKQTGLEESMREQLYGMRSAAQGDAAVVIGPSVAARFGGLEELARLDGGRRIFIDRGADTVVQLMEADVAEARYYGGLEEAARFETMGREAGIRVKGHLPQEGSFLTQLHNILALAGVPEPVIQAGLEQLEAGLEALAVGA